jgi:hypothetical protein
MLIQLPTFCVFLCVCVFYLMVDTIILNKPVTATHTSIFFPQSNQKHLEDWGPQTDLKIVITYLRVTYDVLTAANMQIN